MISKEAFLVFDIETIPDVAGARRLHDLADITDEQVVELLYAQRRRETGTEFLKPHLHRVCCISAVLRHRDQVKVWSLGEEDASEAELIQRFFDGIARFTPTLISWNGAGFDLPVLNYRALINGVCCPRYWELGNEETQFRYNNYLSRFHWRHVDLMDVLSGYQARMVAPLDAMATMLGFPGKMGMSGAHVWTAYQQGDLASIRHYCETDVLNTYLVWLRFQRMRGQLTEAGLVAEQQLLKKVLNESNKPHLQAFLTAWEAAPLADASLSLSSSCDAELNGDTASPVNGDDLSCDIRILDEK